MNNIDGRNFFQRSVLEDPQFSLLFNRSAYLLQLAFYRYISSNVRFLLPGWYSIKNASKLPEMHVFRAINIQIGIQTIEIGRIIVNPYFVLTVNF